MNPLEQKTKELDSYFMSFEKLYPKAYDKVKTHPYTKTRVILMNGTEYESVWFLHQFARHCDNKEICDALAIVRKQEQQQQKRIACLKPIDESILETTIAYEQLAVDLTASLAINENDRNNRQALNFALLEDFDHLYRFSNLLMMDKNMDKNINPKTLVGAYTEIMPGRPTISEHRYPTDDLKNHMNANKSELYSKLVASIITAAEQQTMNYYMNIAQWYKNDLGRKLYSEIAMIEEEHVSQYESLKDPNMTWLEMWVLHEYCECYLYYSAYKDENDKYIKDIWKEHYEMECAHLKIACDMLKKYEKKSCVNVIGDGEFPILLQIGSHKEYIRDVLQKTITETAKDRTYIDISKLPDNDKFFNYQNILFDDDKKKVPSHLVVANAIKELKQDYRYQDSEHPVECLKDRTKDNTEIGRKA